MDADGRSSMGSGSGTSKRRRIAMACQACRTRKSRCDGRRPQCSTCDELDFDCIYVASAASSNVIVGKQFFAALEHRLSDIEQRLDGISNGHDTSPLQPGFSTSQGRQACVADEGGRSISNRRSGLVAVDDVDAHDGANEDSTDGMGAIVFTDEEDSGFFGPSSNIAFTRHLSRAVARLSSTDHTYPTPGTHDGGLMRVSRPPSPSRTQDGRSRGHSRWQTLNLFALPPEDETLDLVQRYFSNTGLLFPYVHEETFLETYGAMKRTNFTKVRKTWLGLLNMVLALATSTTVSNATTAEQRAEMSDVYYQRALGLCDKHVWRGASIELVQYLLMMGQYLQGTQKSTQTWNIHGLAVKAALQLGLHSAEASKKLSPIEQETSKRLWYGCVILDRTLSMTFGRPAAIPDSYVRLALPVDFDHIAPETSAEDPRKRNSTLFFTMTITLYKVMWNVIDLLYGANIGCGASANVFEVMASLFKMEQQLMAWERSLPANMALRKSQEISSEEDDTERYRIILTLRYHNLRILIHRLVVVRFLDTCGKADRDEQELALLRQIGSNSVQICVHSSLEIISIVSTIVHSTGVRQVYLGAWWFSLYYVFNAALVISACILVDQKTGLTGAATSLPDLLGGVERPLQTAVGALRLLDKGNRMVETCAAFLNRLGQVIISLASDSSTGMPLQLPFLGNDDTLLNSYGGTQAGNTNLQSPLGMDLGEFIMERDLDFLNYFAVNQPLSNAIPPEGGHG
ncbi:uncharacterized protein BDZ99DRAFT_456469 [Mytilinidion resinicola]|uniref:Zn(2)-C6 fungal-type domain-containing protein n=1 Tax=Mytilinidion resinicola TaxID=574789 RepID=A0A6A6XZV6_9PEZI|nr:uncharacterized protein BDZ99DRAFT_456469 [Mytilinidion resinicola]KAF2801274.1 hypothetical protein BDZ99DRAFT_456469 [Mytilinidion resinicola]